MKPFDPVLGQDAADLAAAGEMLDTMGATPFDSAAPKGMDGTLQSLKGLMRPSAGAGRSAMLLASYPNIVADKVQSLVTGEETTQRQDAGFEIAEDLGNSAVDFWTPDAATMGTTAKTINMVGNVIGSVPQMIGTPGLFLANSGVDPAAELVRQGVDSDTALAVGGVNLSVTALGMRLPAAFGSNLATRVATGAGSNLALGVGADLASSAALDAGGYEQAAEGYNPADPYARGLDVLMGIAFGAAAHVDAPRLAPSQRDAVLVANNAAHVEQGTMPGTPLAKGADVRHQTALATAIKQSLSGERVDVAGQIKLEDFLLKPELRPLQPAAGGAVGFDANVAQVLRAEGGYVNDPVDRGGETKFGISKRANPEVDIANLTPEGAAAIYRKKYWDQIKADELPAHMQGTAFDAAVNQGVNWTRNALKRANGSAKHFNDLREAQYRRIVQEDPSQAKFLRGWLNRLGKFKETSPAGESLRTRLVENPEQLATDYAALKDSEGGVILNTDVARELSPEYLADRTRSADVHEAASDFVKTIYERKLAEPTPEGMDRTVMFTAGGTGAGKTTGLMAMGEARGRPEIVYDTNMNTLGSAVEKIEQALTAGRDVQIAYVYRDPVEALTAGALPRAERQAKEFGSGRTVPLAEHAKTHTGVRPVMEALAKKYADDPRVKITAIDNSRGKGKEQVVELADLPHVEQNSLHERLNEALESARSAGLSDSIYRGFKAVGRPDSGVESNRRPPGGAASNPEGRSRSEAGEVTPAPELDAAAQLAASLPQLEITLDDGTVATAADALARADADIAQAQTDANGFAAAVSCMMRFS